MLDALGRREPSLIDRRRLFADRHEACAIPRPDCAERAMNVTIEHHEPTAPRTVRAELRVMPFGTLEKRSMSCAFAWLGPLSAGWEGKS